MTTKCIMASMSLLCCAMAFGQPTTSYQFYKPLKQLSVVSNCKTPWGSTILNHNSVMAYGSVDTVSGTCASESRLCTDGVLSGSFPNASCAAPAAASCTTPWNTGVASGYSVLAYQLGAVSFGSTCTSETRTCSNGTLSGSFTYSDCTVAPAAACNTPWNATIVSGSSVTAYQTDSVAYGQSCASQSRSCMNGSLSGTYNYETCSVAAPASCTLADGTVMAHGETLSRYSTDYVTSPDTCTGYAVQVSCSNGVASPSPSYASCAVHAPSTTSLLMHADSSLTPEIGPNTTIQGGSINNTTYKVGSGSLYLSGTAANSGIMIQDADALNFGTGDFTIQFWARPSTYSTSTVLFSLGNYSVDNTLMLFWRTNLIPTAKLHICPGNGSNACNALTTTSTPTITANTWTHIAIVRKSGILKLYINGTAVTSATDTVDRSKSPLIIGSADIPGSTTGLGGSYGYSVPGYYDEIMVSKSALYSANFTPSTAPN